MKDSKEEVQQIVLKSPHSIDQLLSRELLQLSLKDRNAVDEEIHGVSTLAPAETPDFLEASLEELSRELDNISDNRITEAFLESQKLPQTYVNSPQFRLRFLRCEFFDAKKAAIRMVKFLDFASNLFGPIVLQRPIRMIDFTKAEKKYMEVFQILPYRDQSGRQIIAWVDNFNLQLGDMRSRTKVALYLRYCMSDDIETQQKGYITLIWIGSNPLPMPSEWEYFEYGLKMWGSSPIRNCSVHWCMPKIPLFHPIHIVRCGYTLSMGKEQSRTKFHVGEQVELLYELKTYGIPTEWIPVTNSGKVKTKNLKQWMKFQAHLEEAREEGSREISSITYCPRSTDVIFRGGTMLKCHPGNSMFENMIEEKIHDHLSACQAGKKAITKSIIKSIQEEGSFLIWDKRGWWKELKNASDIHHKVAEKVRYLTSKLSAHQQISRSSTLVFQNQDNSKRRKISSSGDYSSDGSSCEDTCWVW